MCVMCVVDLIVRSIELMQTKMISDNFGKRCEFIYYVLFVFVVIIWSQIQYFVDISV